MFVILWLPSHAGRDTGEMDPVQGVAMLQENGNITHQHATKVLKSFFLFFQTLFNSFNLAIPESHLTSHM